MNKQPNDLKYLALEASVYYPTYKEENSIGSITVNDFDIEEIKAGVRNSVDVLSYNKAHGATVIELLDVLDQYRDNFLIEQQKCISFYWLGMLIYRVNINKNVDSQDKQMHVSLKNYVVELNTRTETTIEKERGRANDAYAQRVLTLTGLVTAISGVAMAISVFAKRM